MTWWTAFVEVFRFFKRRRERLNAAQQAERDHQLKMLEKFAEMMLAQSQASQQGILEIARALQASAEANASILHEWLKSFQQTPDPVPAQIADSSDEWEYDDLTSALQARTVPAELRLAFELHQKDEGRDES